MKILIVTDDDVVAARLRQFLDSLEESPASSTATTTDAEARTRQIRPDLLIIDVLPGDGGGGVLLADRLRTHHRATLVFVVPELDPQSLRLVVDAEPLGFVTKPLTRCTMQSSLPLCLRRHSQLADAQNNSERIRTTMQTLLNGTISNYFGNMGLVGEKTGSSTEGPEGNEGGQSRKVSHLESILDRIALDLVAVDSPTTRVAGALPLSSLPSLTAREREVLRAIAGGNRVSTIATKLVVAPSTVRNHLKSIFRKLEVRSQTELMEYLDTLRN